MARSCAKLPRGGRPPGLPAVSQHTLLVQTKGTNLVQGVIQPSIHQAPLSPCFLFPFSFLPWAWREKTAIVKGPLVKTKIAARDNATTPALWQPSSVPGVVLGVAAQGSGGVSVSAWL